MLVPVDRALNRLVSVRWLAIEGFVVIETVSIENSIKSRVPTTLETDTQKPVGIRHRVTSEGNERTENFLKHGT